VPGGDTVVGGHRDFEHALRGGARGSFAWAPYEANMSAALDAWARGGRAAPDVVVLGASLWHALHIGQLTAHAAELRALRAAVLRLRRQRAGGAGSWHGRAPRPLIFWQSTTWLVPSKLNSARKRAQLTSERMAAYDAASEAALLAPRGPCLPLDVAGVTRGCGPNCTEDGMHYSNTTYHVLLQQWANALRFVAAFEARKSMPGAEIDSKRDTAR